MWQRYAKCLNLSFLKHISCDMHITVFSSVLYLIDIFSTKNQVATPTKIFCFSKHFTLDTSAYDAHLIQLCNKFLFSPKTLVGNANKVSLNKHICFVVIFIVIF